MRVDQRHRVGAAFPGGARRVADVGDVGGELDHDRHARRRFAPARHHLDIFRHLADRRAHAALAHPVRAAEVEFDAVAAGLLDLLQDPLPARLLAGHHQRDEEAAVRPVALDPLDLLEVHFKLAVGDQLEVVEADQAAVAGMDRAIARTRDVDDRRVLAERLPHHAAPSRLEGADDVVFLVGRRRRGQPERVRRPDADEFAAEIGHISLQPCQMWRTPTSSS